MKKIKMIIMFFGIFLLLGAVNVKAYDVTSLSGTYSVTINKFKLNLYEVPEENATSVALFANPITYELPMGTNDFQITGDTLKAKELRVDENITIPLSLVELSDNFNATKVGEFLNNQTFDKTKTYYGDIEVEYTVNSFPSTFRSFSQVNAIRYFMEQISEMFNAFVTAEGSGNVSTSASFTLEKPGLVTTTLTSDQSMASPA